VTGPLTNSLSPTSWFHHITIGETAPGTLYNELLCLTMSKTDLNTVLVNVEIDILTTLKKIIHWIYSIE